MAIGCAAIMVLAGWVAVTPPAVAAEPEPNRSCVDVQPDAATAEAMVGVCRRRVEILAERTEVSQTFVNPDGSRTLEQGIEPVRVRKGSSWRPVDTTLKLTADGVVPRATVLPLVFSGGGDAPLARIRDGDRELAMVWPGRLPAPELRGDTATYREVLPGVDLRVTAQPLGFSEVLVVRTREAAADPKLASLRFGLRTRGVTVRATGEGGLAARDAAGREVFTAPAPLMWDSSTAVDATSGKQPQAEGQSPEKAGSGAPGRSNEKGGRTGAGKDGTEKGPAAGALPDGGRRAVMPVRVDGDQLTIIPDRKILTDPNAKLPIFIDPAWTGNFLNAWTSVWSKHKSSSFWNNASALTNGGTYGSAGAGRTEDCSGCADHIIRSFFRMNTSGVRGKHILGATFRIEQRHAWTCSPKSNAKLWLTGSISSGTTWNKQPTWNSKYTAQTAANRKVGSAHGCLGTGSIEFNVKTMITHAAASNWSSITLGLRAISESTKNQWKRFKHSSPRLAITYNTNPNAPGERFSDGKVCATGAARPYVLSTTPILAARQSDPDSGQQSLTTWFHWWPLGGSRNDTDKIFQATANPATASRAVPAGKLVDGGTYVWQSRTYDGSHYGAWSGTCEFTVDATPPAIPGDLDSTDYPDDDDEHGGVGLEGTFTIAPPAQRPHEVVAYAWSLDGGAQPSSAPTVPARSTDFGATLTVRPARDGVHVLRVWSKDRAGRFSLEPVTHRFKVQLGGPAADWTFDEATGDAVDVTEHGNTATLAGGATRTGGRGDVGGSLSLNGSTGHAATTGPVVAPDPFSGDPTPLRTDASFTVTARVKLAAPGTGTISRAIVAADGSRTAAFRLGYNEGVNKWAFSMTSADVDNPGVTTVLSDGTATAGKWTHLAGVFDATTRQLRLYVNGVAQTATATLSGGFNATGRVNIGQRTWNGVVGDRFNGAVDDVRLYAYAETPARLAELAVPLAPTVTFPDGTEATAGGQLRAVFDAKGDTNVMKFRYSVGDTGLGTEVAATTPGGTATVQLNAGSLTGERAVHFVAVDDGSRVSPRSEARFLVTAAASVSGTAIDGSTFDPVVGATVTLQPIGLQTVTDSSGNYSFTGFPPGSYTIAASIGGRCGLSGSVDVDIDGPNLRQDLYLFPYSDDLGYECAEQTATFAGAEQTVLPLTGDNAVTEVALPFAFPFYGQAYLSAFVDTNGLVSFTDPGGSHPYQGGQIPTPAEPNALVAPFWDDLVVDASASVRTAVTGSGDAERFVIEWRNVHRKASTAQRLSFEVILAPDGTVTTNYSGLDNDAERGAQAAVGIEAPAGEDGLPYSRNEAILASGRAVVFDHPEAGSPIEVFDLSGTLLTATGAPAVGATVTLDPSGLSTVTGAGGAWRFDDLVADSYTVSSSSGAGRCPTVARTQVELAADTVQNLQLGPDYAGFGYACTEGAAGFQPASTVLALTGDDAATQVTSLPFPITYHGRTYQQAWVHTNGLIHFGDAVDLNKVKIWINPRMPTADAPDAVVAPFWDDLEVDSQASVRTQTMGTAPNRSYVVEWRNVRFRADLTARTTFEVIFHEDGRIAFHYGALNNAWAQGAAATVGLENSSGNAATQYLYHEIVLNSNSSIVYTPAAAGTISGTLTTASTGTPMAGATITLNPSGRSVTTGADGSYQFSNVPVGEYEVTAPAPDSRCAGQYAQQVINFAGGTADVDLSMMHAGDEFGYTCNTISQAFVPGDVVQQWSGDETVWQAPGPLPFPIKLYGESYTSAWISANGLISFRDPAFFGWIGSVPDQIPSPDQDGKPNAAVYVHWDDWVVDSQARIATKSSGSSPNRQWVVEWRNVHHFEDPTARASFEVIFHENGDIVFVYGGIDAAKPLERGAGATVGIEDASGSIAFQYLHYDAWLTAGQAIRFRPTPPGVGAVTGTVTCQGNPVSGAGVSVAGRSATTGSDGGYEIGGVPAGSYAVVATVPSGTCRGSTVQPVVVGSNAEEAVDFPAAATPAGGGYTLLEQNVPFTAANGTVLSLTGDDAYRQVTLPFPVSLYGQTYSTGWVDTNGLVTFVNPGESASDAWPIPSPPGAREPNAAVYPFWHDWVVDANASVRTATLGTAPNRRFVVEWRNVRSYEDAGTRISFEVIFDEAGGYTFAYSGLDGTFLERGGGATIGIENATGTAALQYTYRHPVLRPGLGIRINAPTS